MSPVSTIVTLVIVLATLAFGAVYPWGYVPLFVAALCIGVGGLIVRRGVTVDARGIARALAVVIVVIAGQLVPLPPPVLHVLSPHAADLLSRYSLAFIRSSGSHALSVNPAATQLSLLGVGALGLYAVGLTGLLSRRDLRSLPRNLVLFAVILSIVGIYFREHDNGLVYGFWMPEGGVNGSEFGPFVNRNHFGGWMVMTTCLAIGVLCAHVELTRDRIRPGLRNRIVWLSSPEASRIVLLAAGISVMAIALVWTLSRSAIVSFTCAVGCFIWLTGRRRSVRPIVRAGIIAALGAVLLASLNWRGLDRLLNWFGNTEDIESRFAAWRDGWHVVRAFPFAGSGMSTYPVVMLFYQQHILNVWMTRAHNDYLQLLAEGGVLVTMPAVVLLWLLVTQIRRRADDVRANSYDYWVRTGASVGLVAIGIQETVDFSLRIPANAFLFATLAAVAIAPVHGPDDRRIRR